MMFTFFRMFIVELAAIIMISAVIPLMYREAKYRGLGYLPKLLLVLGIISAFSSLVTPYLIYCRIAMCDSGIFFNVLALFNSFGYIASAVAWFLIYRQKY